MSDFLNFDKNSGDFNMANELYVAGVRNLFYKDIGQLKFSPDGLSIQDWIKSSIQIPFDSFIAYVIESLTTRGYPISNYNLTLTKNGAVLININVGNEEVNIAL